MPTQAFGKGAIFTNSHKKPESNQPDRKGDITFDMDIKAGTTVDISGWLKKDKKGDTYLFVVVSEKYVKQEGGGQSQGSRQSAPASNAEGNAEDNIPF